MARSGSREFSQDEQEYGGNFASTDTTTYTPNVGPKSNAGPKSSPGAEATPVSPSSTLPSPASPRILIYSLSNSSLSAINSTSASEVSTSSPSLPPMSAQTTIHTHSTRLVRIIAPSVILPTVLLAGLGILILFLIRRRRSQSRKLRNSASFLPNDGFGSASHHGSNHSVSIAPGQEARYDAVARDDPGSPSPPPRDSQSEILWTPSHPFATYSPIEPGSDEPFELRWIPAGQTQALGRRPSASNRRNMRLLRAVADHEAQRASTADEDAAPPPVPPK